MTEIQDYAFRTDLIEGIRKTRFYSQFCIKLFIKGCDVRNFIYNTEKERDEDFDRIKEKVD